MDHDGLFEVLYTQDGVEEDYFKGEILTNVGKNIDMPATVAGPSGYNTTDMTLESVGSNHYSARWHGYLVPTESGIHTLQSTTDDGFKLWVDQNLVIDNWHADAAAQQSAEITLVADKRYPIRAEYFESTELNAFDNIAKESRKYGLFLCLSTQMPRDIPVGTLSQMGTFITHRLINYQDKEAIASACSTANKETLSFLPSLGSGEAIIMGVDFPMPISVKVDMPTITPKFDTPKFVKIAGT